LRASPHLGLAALVQFLSPLETTPSGGGWKIITIRSKEKKEKHKKENSSCEAVCPLPVRNGTLSRRGRRSKIKKPG
jgi:hypothetical protein